MPYVIHDVGSRSRMANTKPIALWAVPRSLSTAFERVFVERDDIEVLHEPFSAAYYHGPDRLSERYSDVDPRPENSYENVLAEVFKPRQKRLFLKDMPYQAKGVMTPEFISRFTNTFIVRDPKYVLLSLYKMWPDFTLEETGFEQIYNLFPTVCDLAGAERPPGCRASRSCHS
jgi:Sulfotransferase domain